MINHLGFVQGFTDRCTGGGFDKEKIEIFMSETPEYGSNGYCPLAHVWKGDKN